MQSQTLSNPSAVADKASFLRRALLSDALFSLLSSLVFIFAAEPVARFLAPNVPGWIVLAVGISFLPFAAGIFWITSDIEARGQYGRIILVLNFVWAVGSYLLLFLLWSQFHVAGRWFIALQAEVIFVLGILQTIGLRRLNR